jgi:predicted nucleic acid-binding protein
MKRILFDTDVILDFLFNREPYAEDTLRLLLLCEKKQILGFVTPVIISNTYYILRQQASHEIVLEKLKMLLSILKVLTMNNVVVHLALNSRFKDFEDALQYYSAIKSEKIDSILTRNTKDFKEAKLPVFTPKEFLQTI